MSVCDEESVASFFLSCLQFVFFILVPSFICHCGSAYGLMYQCAFNLHANVYARCIWQPGECISAKCPETSRQSFSTRHRSSSATSVSGAACVVCRKYLGRLRMARVAMRCVVLHCCWPLQSHENMRNHYDSSLPLYMYSLLTYRAAQSLNDVFHGLLRGNRPKHGGGLFGNAPQISVRNLLSIVPALRHL